ncbi:hypothetical protein [Sabulibacter ruber]|uniref:hypothetical protein n=1 Tax=Sabulibacter ruber TaxID=2811901 RepID=UPI001A956B8B|nr:hypothetical protein [Sabulibacter ruber]
MRSISRKDTQNVAATETTMEPEFMNLRQQRARLEKCLPMTRPFPTVVFQIAEEAMQVIEKIENGTQPSPYFLQIQKEFTEAIELFFRRRGKEGAAALYATLTRYLQEKGAL